MRQIVITSVSRLPTKAALNVSGIDLQTDECLTLMPHPSREACRQLNVVPGSVLGGIFSPVPGAEAPHIEDAQFQNLTFVRHCSTDEFRQILARSAVPSLEQGLGPTLEDRQKFVTREMEPVRSLITIAVTPAMVEVVQDGFGYSPSNLKAHITDHSGKEYTYLPVADAGFHAYAESHYRELADYQQLNGLIHGQKEIFLCIGLSRFHEAVNGRAGYWIQIVGIYGFPAFFDEARAYP